MKVGITNCCFIIGSGIVVVSFCVMIMAALAFVLDIRPEIITEKLLTDIFILKGGFCYLLLLLYCGCWVILLTERLGRKSSNR